MKFDAWVSGFAVRAKKSEREVVVRLRWLESVLEQDDLKALTRSVYKEGSKVKLDLGFLDDRPQVTESVQSAGWLSSIRVTHGPDGRFIEAAIRVPEKDFDGRSFKLLASAVRSGAETSVSVDLEPAITAQIEMPDSDSPAGVRPKKGKKNAVQSDEPSMTVSGGVN